MEGGSDTHPQGGLSLRTRDSAPLTCASVFSLPSLRSLYATLWGGWRAGRPEHFPGAQVALLTLARSAAAGAQLCSSSAPGEAAVLLQRLRPGPAAESCLRRGTLLSGKLTPGFPWPWLLGGDKTRGVATECYRPVAPDHKRPLHAPDSSVLTVHTSHHPIVNSQIKTFSEQID